MRPTKQSSVFFQLSAAFLVDFIAYFLKQNHFLDSRRKCFPPDLRIFRIHFPDIAFPGCPLRSVQTVFDRRFQAGEAFLFVDVESKQGGPFGSGRSGISGNFRIGSEFGRQSKENLVGEFG